MEGWYYLTRVEVVIPEKKNAGYGGEKIFHGVF